jgi:PKD repeat protein
MSYIGDVVYIDDNGNLKTPVVYRDGIWTTINMYTNDFIDYGSSFFTVTEDLTQYCEDNPAFIYAPFYYDYTLTGPYQGRGELDLEVSKWNVSSNPNNLLWTTYYGAYNPGVVYNYSQQQTSHITGAGNTFGLDWQNSYINFTVWGPSQPYSRLLITNTSRVPIKQEMHLMLLSGVAGFPNGFSGYSYYEQEVTTDYSFISVIPPTANLTGTPTTIYNTQSVSFTDNSDGVISSWLWNFGDDQTSTLKNPSHQYISIGTFTVTLTVSNSAGTDTIVKTNYITSNGPTADFTATPTSGNAPLSVTFSSSLSTGIINYYLYDWGDGTGYASFSGPPPASLNHVYTTPGVYTVSLTVGNAGGENTMTRTNYIWAGSTSYTLQLHTGWNLVSTPLTIKPVNISEMVATQPKITQAMVFNSATQSYMSYFAGAPPEYDFPFNTSTGYMIYVNGDCAYTFTGFAPTRLSSSIVNGKTAIGWSNMRAIDPKSLAAALAGTQTIQYYDGTYKNYTEGSTTTPFLIQPGRGFYVYSDTVTTLNYDSVPLLAPIAGFSASPINGYAPLPVTFTDTTTGYTTGWSWTFGDGGTSTSQSPSHTYNYPGTYIVRLSASNPEAIGVTSTTITVFLNPAPTPTPTPSPTGAPTVTPTPGPGYHRQSPTTNRSLTSPDTSIYNKTMYDFTGGGDPGKVSWNAFIGDVIIPIIMTYGPLFWGLLCGVIILLIYNRQESGVIPVFLALAGGAPIILWTLPYDWQKAAGTLVTLVIAGVLYALRKKRY